MEDIHAHGRRILKHGRRSRGGVVCIHLAQNGVQGKGILNRTMKLRDLQKIKNYLARQVTSRYSKRYLLYADSV
jgi:hypothetical protein